MGGDLTIGKGSITLAGAMNPLKRLTQANRQFALEYVREGNAKRAYRIAYPDAEESTCGARSSELLKDALVQKLVKKYQKLLEDAHEVDAHRVMAEMKAVGFARVTDVVEIAETAVPVGDGETVIHEVRLRPAGEIPDEALAAISEISTGKDGSFKVKMHNKMEALTKIGNTLGMFKEEMKVDVTVKHDLTEAAKETLERLRANKGRLEGAEEVKEVA